MLTNDYSLSNKSKIDFDYKDYCLESLRSFNPKSEIEHKFDFPIVQKEVYQKAADLIKENHCECDLAHIPKITKEPQGHSDSTVCCVVNNCCISMDDICKCMTDTSSNLNDIVIYSGDNPNQFNICIENRSETGKSLTPTMGCLEQCGC